MEALENLLSLRAVRAFEDRPVPDGVVRRMLEVARWTGTSGNKQRLRYIVVRDRLLLSELAAIRAGVAHLGGAALAIAPVCEGEPGIDLGRAIERLMLAAHAQGLGACIASFHVGGDERAAALLGVPPTHRVPHAISFGYPAARQPVPPIADTGRLPLSAIVSEERFPAS